MASQQLSIVKSKSGSFNHTYVLTQLKWLDTHASKTSNIELVLKDVLAVAVPSQPAVEKTMIKVSEADAKAIKYVWAQVIKGDLVFGGKLKKPLSVDEVHGVVLSAITIPKGADAPTLTAGERYAELVVQVVGVLQADDRKASLLFAVRSGQQASEAPLEDVTERPDEEERLADELTSQLRGRVDQLKDEIAAAHGVLALKEERAAHIQGVIDAVDPYSESWLAQARAVLGDADLAKLS